MVFELVLVMNTPIDFVEGSFTGRRPPGGLAIFRTSKQIYEEAIAVFYSQNKFAMNGTDIERFLSIKRINHVRSLSIHLDSGISINKVLRAIERCQDLRSLHIDLGTLPHVRGLGNGIEERMRSLKFKRPTKLRQISTGVWRFSPPRNLEPLCCILQNILEEGESVKPLKPLRESPRLSSQRKPSDGNRR